MKKQRILIFTPIYEEKDYCLEEFIEHALKINYPYKRHIIIDNSATLDYYNKLKELLEPKGFEVYHVNRGNNTREALARAQNFARKIFLDENYDYLFSLESDIMIKPDTLTKLVITGKEVISALYLIGDKDKGIRIPCATVPEYNDTLKAYGTRLLNADEIKGFYKSGLQRVAAAGMGACLMDRRIIEQFIFKYDPRFITHSDVYFFNDCFNKQIPVYIHTDLLLRHENSDWSKVKDR